MNFEIHRKGQSKGNALWLKQIEGNPRRIQDLFLEFSKSVFRLHINNLIEQDFMEGQSEGNPLNTKSKIKKIFWKSQNRVEKSQ